MTALTTAERQSRRQAALNQKAQALGYPTWRKLETDFLKGKMEIKMATMDFEKFIAKESSTSELVLLYDDAETAARNLHEYVTEQLGDDYPEPPTFEDCLTWINSQTVTYDEAIAHLTTGGHSEFAYAAILAEVEPLCQTPTDGDTTLEDWIKAGYYDDPRETAEEIAAEWDALSKE